MSLFRTILVAADFSEGTQESFRVACSLVQEGEGRVVVLYVAEPSYAAAEPVYFRQQAIQFSVVERPPEYYEALKDRLREFYPPTRSLKVEHRARVGAVVAEEVLREAEDLKADLIVMGTHGRTGLRRLLVGSVVEAVLRHSPCPVLALRASASSPAPDKLRVILHPTDFSDPSEDALRVARSLARDHGARLVLLHVEANQVVAEGMIVVPSDPGLALEGLDKIRKTLDGPDLKFPVEARVRDGDPVPQIIGEADDLKADLIVMGTHGRSGLGRLLLGSVAEGVVRRAPCPVIAVRTTLPSETNASKGPAKETARR